MFISEKGVYIYIDAKIELDWPRVNKKLLLVNHVYDVYIHIIYISLSHWAQFDTSARLGAKSVITHVPMTVFTQYEIKGDTNSSRLVLCFVVSPLRFQSLIHGTLCRLKDRGPYAWWTNRPPNRVYLLNGDDNEKHIGMRSRCQRLMSVTSDRSNRV